MLARSCDGLCRQLGSFLRRTQFDADLFKTLGQFRDLLGQRHCPQPQSVNVQAMAEDNQPCANRRRRAA